MRGGVCAGRLDNLLLHSLPEPHFLAIPKGVLDFRGPEMNPPTPSSGTLFSSVPQRRARFPGLVSFSFRGPLKSQWALQAFEDTLLGMRGVCAAQGNGVPRKAVPAKRSGKACLCKMGMREGMRTIYIYNVVHNSARVCARVCASYIYVFSRKLTLQRAWYARGYARYIYIGFRTLFELMARRHIFMKNTF